MVGVNHTLDVSDRLAWLEVVLKDEPVHAKEASRLDVRGEIYIALQSVHWILLVRLESIEDKGQERARDISLVYQSFESGEELRVREEFGYHCYYIEYAQLATQHLG